jgi:clan AA aspartic protease (TIGR02281 family)
MACSSAANGESVALQQEGGTFVVPVLVNARITLNFTVDSGAADVSVPADVFSTLIRTGTVTKSDFIDVQVYQLADGSERRAQRFRIRSLRVGSLELRDVIASVAPPSGTLLLGQSFLARLKSWSIDNQRHVLEISQQPTHDSSIQARVVTSLGDFTIELNSERAPLTVAHFLKYVYQGQYSGTIFHRVIPNFVIQGGGFDSNYKAKAAPYKVVNESGNGLSNQRGTVGMARGPEPHSGDCQFYINLYDNRTLDPNKSRWGYAVFGEVVQGMDVVDRIANVPTGARGNFKEDAPLEPVVIERIQLVSTP